MVKFVSKVSLMLTSVSNPVRAEKSLATGAGYSSRFETEK